MKCRVTIKVKIGSIPEVKSLSEKYLIAVQYSVNQCFKDSPKHKFDLHHLVYKDLRSRFDLKSQFAINAIAQAFETYKSTMKLNKTKPVIKSAPIVFDKRLASFNWSNLRISTEARRIDVSLNIAPYYSRYSKWSFQTAELIKDSKHRHFFNITLSKDVDTDTSNTTKSVVGIDIGVRNLAVTSDGQVFKAYRTKYVQYNWLRRKLQRKGTKSAKRKLKFLGSRWKRFMRDVNHCISKQIVHGSGDIFVLEDLTHIRKRTTGKYRKSKKCNRWLSGWSFRQLQSMIVYKAEMLGKTVKFVNPYLTSQTCSNCGCKGSRFRDRFYCPHCNSALDSDYNASCNLRRLLYNPAIQLM